MPDDAQGRCPSRLSCAGYIRVTQGFSILAALWGLVAVIFLGMSCIPALSAPGRGPIVSCFTAFAAGKERGQVKI